MRRDNKKFKTGAASFYIVVFATLVLMVIASSFAAIIISEVTRTSNDDLSQSAYDSAMAGVEDAKLAFYNYQNCVNGDINSDSCNVIRELMEQPTCDMVSKIVGRYKEGEENHEVKLQETTKGENNMQQAYTCVKLETILNDYKATLSGSNQTKVIRVGFNDDTNGDGVADLDVANRVSRMVVSWYKDADSNKYKYNNFDTGNGVKFPPAMGGAVAQAYAEPPTLSVAMVQTAQDFDIESFDMTQNAQTNRGMVYLVPANDKLTNQYNVERSGVNYINAYNGSENWVSNTLTRGSGIADRGNNYGGFLKSNDKTNKNLPYVVYCPKDAGNDYVCSATIELPRPIGDGTRNKDTFVFAVSMPYGQPTTDFELKFYCDDGVVCSTEENDTGGTSEKKTSNLAQLQDVQIKVDSTGRANDLYRRVETRLEGTDDFSLSALGPLELLGSGDVLKKDYTVTCEYDFNATCSR